ncbi:hypothetical protein DF134_19250 [Burkholderia stagnalis]|uniref:hypothetical protein n=1 Tax=Burkholderia stagnalis TaxID=1503054 RepID=UPI000F5A90E4|nr:hypothetical protein [Burkholderia stagnalis]RQQ88715.1 hypothetical protein DF134_19250 [Burkholderia stagnalis]
MVFKLMGEATRAGKRLSDVVEHTWAHLKAAGNPLAYLRKLLTLPTDYSHAVRAKHAEQVAAEQAEQAAEEATELARRCAGQTFYAPDASRRFDVAPDASRITMTSASDGISRDMGTQWRLHFAAALQARKAIAETPELMAQFQAAMQQHPQRALPSLTQRPDQPRTLTSCGGVNFAAIKRILGMPQASI